MAPTIRSEPRMQENIKILLQALRDPKNRQLRDSIRHALRAAGLTKGEISSYEITGNFYISGNKMIVGNETIYGDITQTGDYYFTQRQQLTG